MSKDIRIWERMPGVRRRKGTGKMARGPKGTSFSPTSGNLASKRPSLILYGKYNAGINEPGKQTRKGYRILT